MSQPDRLSEQIEAFRCSFAAYGDTGVTLAPQAIEHLDALFMAFAVQARELEAPGRIDEPALLANVDALRRRMIDERLAKFGVPPMADAPKDASLPLDRVLADLDAEKRAIDAMTASIAATNERLRALRARQDALAAPNVVVFPGARLGGPRIAHGRSIGDVEVSTALAILAGLHNDDRAADGASDGDCA